MARRVFFSFHYERDIWRANQVRNSWVSKPDRETAGFWDAASWEQVKKEGDDAIRSWINNQLANTSVTAVLIGAETSNREWVRYEIQKSIERSNGLVGIYVHNIKDQFGKTDTPGNNNFGEIEKDNSGNPIYFWQRYQTYDWVNDNGYHKLGSWVEEVAKKAGK